MVWRRLVVLVAIVLGMLQTSMPTTIAQDCPGLGGGQSEVVTPCDPNEKKGPSGFGPARHVAELDGFYTVFFENVPSASVPAQEVIVVDFLGPALDGESIELGEIAFGSQVVTDLYGLQGGATSVPLEGSDLAVEISAVYDTGAHQITWTLRTVDPRTGELPGPEYDAIGVLPPNDDSGRGEGHVSFTVQPISGLATGTEISNVATITFDTNAPITTNTWMNTIDIGGPSSSVVSVAPVGSGAEQWRISWNGADDAGGSGIKSFAIYVSEDREAPYLWQSNTTTTSAQFVVTCGKTYEFYSRATDNVGNVEDVPARADRTLVSGADGDADGVCDGGDNCSGVFNPGQEDFDHDGVGEQCDTGPVVTVAASGADFDSIQAAIDGSSESGTVIQIFPGTFFENVVIDENSAFTIEGMGEAPEGVVISSVGGPAVDVRSGLGSGVVFRNLVIQGADGIRAIVGTRIENVTFRSIMGTALDLLAGDHVVKDVKFGPDVADAVRVGFGATLNLRDGRFAGVSGTGIYADGQVDVMNALMVEGGTALRTGPNGSAAVRFGTITNNTLGIDNPTDATVTIAESIVHGNAGSDLLGVPCGSISYSNVSPECAGENGNLSEEPGFVSGYRLGVGSPCLDAGAEPATYNGRPAGDLDGDLRLRDYDGDGLAYADMGAFEATDLMLTPVDVPNVHWIDHSTMLWDAVATASEYHVYTGDLAEGTAVLSYGFFGACADSDLDPVDRTDQTVVVRAVPPPGTGWFFVISAEDAGGSEGTLGYGSSAERSNFQSCLAP